MKFFIIFSVLFTTLLFGNITGIASDEVLKVKGKFSRNKKCIRCHLDIYKEFQKSKHHLSNISNNPAHKAMWESNPLSKEQKYVCAKCHAPAVENIESVMSGKTALKMDDQSLTDGISCAACHRIEEVHPTPKGDKYIISDKKRRFFGTRKNKQRSEYHDINFKNRHFLNSNVCLTCHAHHKKQKLLIASRDESNQDTRYCVFTKVDQSTKDLASNSKEENCISCHMPQVPGSHSDRVYVPTHASHTFAAISTKIDKPEKFIDLNLTREETGFSVTVQNKLPHDLVLHPTRLFVLKIFVNDKLIKAHEFKKPWKKGNHKPLAWLKEKIVYKDNLLAKSKKVIDVQQALKKEDKVHAELGYYTFNPKLAEEIGFEDKDSLKYRVFIKKDFSN